MPDPPVNLSDADRATIEAALAKLRAEGGNLFLEGHLEAALEGEPRVHPFYCGSQAHDWQDRNCYRCPKFDATKSPASECEVIVALAAAWWDDGSVSAAVARRMGYVEESPPAYTWDCPEREFPTLVAKAKEGVGRG